MRLTAIIVMSLYTFIKSLSPKRQGLESLFANTLFQINRNLQVFLQKIGEQEEGERMEAGSDMHLKGLLQEGAGPSGSSTGFRTATGSAPTCTG